MVGVFTVSGFADEHVGGDGKALVRRHGSQPWETGRWMPVPSFRYHGEPKATKPAMALLGVLARGHWKMGPPPPRFNL